MPQDQLEPRRGREFALVEGPSPLQGGCGSAPATSLEEREQPRVRCDDNHVVATFPIRGLPWSRSFFCQLRSVCPDAPSGRREPSPFPDTSTRGSVVALSISLQAGKFPDSRFSRRWPDTAAKQSNKPKHTQT